MHERPLNFPLLYGIGAAAPVIGFAVIIAYSARIAGLFFNRLAIFDNQSLLINSARPAQ